MKCIYEVTEYRDTIMLTADAEMATAEVLKQLANGANGIDVFIHEDGKDLKFRYSPDSDATHDEVLLELTSPERWVE